ncbi:MAG TPA: hypothetical protein VLG25_03235 [Patescibacteria group bacterium]|nr:hypothetical protein [Patescibacteria group bacterium]
MLAPLFSLFVIALIVGSSEILWYLKKLRREAGRKYIHILSAIWIAFWPFFMSFKAIFFLSIILLAGIITIRVLKIGKAIHTVERLSNGDVLFPIGIAICCVITSSPWIFAAAILNIGLADGLAGLIGSHYNFHEYKVLGHKKSLLGTGVFILTSMMIVAIVFNHGPFYSPSDLIWAITIIPLATALAENISPMGVDNITVPILTSLLLTLIA